MSPNIKLPVLFIGHGSPMNAIQDNPFTRSLNVLGRDLPKPEVILCLSAHWLTDGTWITHMKSPKTIHDFGGFPEALFEIQYPAPGSPEFADKIRTQISDPSIKSDDTLWGLDHGTWAVLRHLYPKADIPVLQLSIDIQKPGDYHLKLGESLRTLRSQGVLIVGSGNIVHNLSKITWKEDAEPYDWAVEFDEWVKAKLLQKNFKALSQDYRTTSAGRLSVPTPEHYYPLLYALGASEPGESLEFPFEGIQNSSISMRTLKLGS
jgi:4,5-DOPA dioxygenase extradiol